MTSIFVEQSSQMTDLALGTEKTKLRVTIWTSGLQIIITSTSQCEFGCHQFVAERSEGLW